MCADYIQISDLKNIIKKLKFYYNLIIIMDTILSNVCSDDL